MKIDQKIALDHIAILVEDLASAVAFCDEKNWPLGPRERFEGEGTEECYIGNDGESKLLLMEAIGPGPYQNALTKRGPGIHHLGFVCEDAKTFGAQMTALGWTEHRDAECLWHETKTLWMQQSGLPLLEIFETKTFPILDFSIRYPFPEAVVTALPGLQNGPIKEAPLAYIYRA